jgi:hypothetical protein
MTGFKVFNRKMQVTLYRRLWRHLLRPRKKNLKWIIFAFFHFLIGHTMPTMPTMAALAALAAVPNHLYVPNLCQFYKLKISFSASIFSPKSYRLPNLIAALKIKLFPLFQYHLRLFISEAYRLLLPFKQGILTEGEGSVRSTS